MVGFRWSLCIVATTCSLGGGGGVGACLPEAEEEADGHGNGPVLAQIDRRLELLLRQPHLLGNLCPTRPEVDPNSNNPGGVENKVLWNHLENQSVHVGVALRMRAVVQEVLLAEPEVEHVEDDKDRGHRARERELGLAQRILVQRVLGRRLELVEPKGEERRRASVRQERQQQVVLNHLDREPNGRGVQKVAVLIEGPFALEQREVPDQVDHEEHDKKHGAAANGEPCLGAQHRRQQLLQDRPRDLGEHRWAATAARTPRSGRGWGIGLWWCAICPVKAVGSGLRHGRNVRLALEHVGRDHGNVRGQVVNDDRFGVDVREGRGSHELHREVELSFQDLDHPSDALGSKRRHGIERRPADSHSLGTQCNRLEDVGPPPDTAVDKHLKLGLVVIDVVQGSHHLGENLDGRPSKVELAAAVVGEQHPSAALLVGPHGVLGGCDPLEHNLHLGDGFKKGEVVPREAGVDKRGQSLGRPLALATRLAPLRCGSRVRHLDSAVALAVPELRGIASDEQRGAARLLGLLHNRLNLLLVLVHVELEKHWVLFVLAGVDNLVKGAA
eukprot:m.448294 g.448294  ORF g.448294 m.448294 type:complete len:557 (-) comp19640_c0_seq1:751-2421(-)